jgi:hypothetical protein
MRARRMLTGVAAALLAATGCRSAAGGGGFGAEGRPSLQYRHVVKPSPRPLQIHAVRYDLRDRSCELACVVATEDPDGGGPAETLLAHPEITVTNRNLLVAVNTNPFRPVADARGRKPRGYVHGWPADILGLAIEDGVRRSERDGSGCNFWIDAEGLPVISCDEPPAAVRQAVGGFNIVLRAGELTMPATDGKSLAPRSGVGFDSERRWLWIVVVDGRQPGYSEGVDLRELGEILLELGCSEGLNFDGGGSSALFLAEAPHGAVRLLNKPSGLLTRPVPVLLGIRRRVAP